MSNGILQDREGNSSSKRIVGFLLIVFGLIGKVIIFYLGCKATDLMVNFANLDSSANTLIVTGAGLIGVSVIEFLGKKE